MQGTLNGITVLDLSRLLPGPYCSMILSDHGARVISIEDRRYKNDGLYQQASTQASGLSLSAPKDDH
jgi:crotonobetainyl-CoA:carnitine CoA-transferase CaiB-like acyl-CoA transferase